jgi:Uma2 family endonuclease
MTAAVVQHQGERRIPMTYDEWLAWASETRLSEWVDGEAIEFMPASSRHQDLVAFLVALMRFFVDLRSLGFVAPSPIEVRLSTRASREPDIVFVSKARAERVEPKRIVGAPDLVVEIISEDSVRRDRVVKRDEYTAVGVLEYWLLDCRPGHEREEFLLLDESGRYREIERDADGRFRSTIVPGFWLDPGWLRVHPLPSVPDCLRAISPEFFGA